MSTNVRVVTTQAHYETHVQADRHHWIVDEPVSAGGSDAGPSPYQQLLAALGSCTSITLRMYADRKQWSLDTIEVRLRHDKIDAEDCAPCETETGMVDRIEREILLTGDLDDDQRSRFLEIANRCPVHRTLTGEINIQTRLVDE